MLTPAKRYRVAKLRGREDGWYVLDTRLNAVTSAFYDSREDAKARRDEIVKEESE